MAASGEIAMAVTCPALLTSRQRYAASSDCPDSSGMGVRNGPEWVSGINRKRFPEWSGIRTLNTPRLPPSICGSGRGGPLTSFKQPSATE